MRCPDLPLGLGDGVQRNAVPLMGQSQGQQHAGRQYLTYFDKRPFQKSPFENVRFLAIYMTDFRQCHKVLLQKVLDFENQLIYLCIVLSMTTYNS